MVWPQRATLNQQGVHIMEKQHTVLGWFAIAPGATSAEINDATAATHDAVKELSAGTVGVHQFSRAVYVVEAVSPEWAATQAQNTEKVAFWYCNEALRHLRPYVDAGHVYTTDSPLLGFYPI